MTDQAPATGPESTQPEDETAPVRREPPVTGVPAVDETLMDLDRLDDAPLEESLPAFERAHESLRSALDAPASDRPGDPD